MTRVKAIKALESINLDRVHPFYDWEEMMEVRDMAISALRAQINQPPNDPLTPEELREMDGEPVWAELLSCTVGQKAGWALVYYSSHIGAACQRWTNWVLWYDEYGKTWTAYRHKQEENRNAET